MTTIRDYRIELGWTITELARKAKLHRQTVASAENGELILPSSAKAIASAISRGLRVRVRPGDIEGLNIQ